MCNKSKYVSELQLSPLKDDLKTQLSDSQAALGHPTEILLNIIKRRRTEGLFVKGS